MRHALDRMSISSTEGPLSLRSSKSEQSAWQPLTPCSDVLVHHRELSPSPSMSLGAQSCGDGLLDDEIWLLDSVSIFDPVNESLLSNWLLG